MKRKCIPIFYACDDNFVKYTMVSLKSMIDNASREYKYNVYILNTNICEEMRQKTLELADDSFKITFEDVTDYLNSVSERLPIRDYYSKTTYYRLFIAEMFKEYDKAVYIDSDTIVLGDISEFYNHDIGNAYVGACNEQAMIQEDVYGTYVEKVLGISRHNFFNAGVLLINCHQFRKNNLLDKFVALLHEYNFVVTQDEDYLNLICHNRVCWIDQKWNTEVFGKINTPDEEIKILHYIMVSKPWHFRDCRYQEYFWKYAKQTSVYEDIVHVLEAYTDEQRKNDVLSCDRLMQTAILETNREDNYLNRKKKPVIQSQDRLEVLEKIRQFEKEGRFDEDVENDPPSRELKPEEIDYLRKRISSKIKTKVAYRMARKFLNRIIDNKLMIIKEIQGLENFKNLDSGAIITCNHFNAFDSFAIQVAYEAAQQKNRRFYRVIREGNYTSFPGFYGFLMKHCNTLPLSSNHKTMHNFMKATDKLLRDGHFVLVYPEQSMWWNYRKPKPLKKGAYLFAVKSNVPVLPCFITMEDSDILGEDGFYIQEYTIHIGKPIYPSKARNQVENIEYMRKSNFESWKTIYEDTYRLPLTYSTE